MLKKISSSVRANILVGVVLTIPVVVTLWILHFLITFATDWIMDLLGEDYVILGEGGTGYAVRLLALLAVLMGFYLVGVLVRSFLGRRFYALSDRLLTRIPLVKRVYLLTRKISESVFTQRETLFKEVVLVEYPRVGLRAVAFVTADDPMLGPETVGYVNLFIPTSPNPTSGVFVIAPRSDITTIDITVQDAIALVISSGAVTPGDKAASSRSLLDKLEHFLQHSGSPDKVPPHVTDS